MKVISLTLAAVILLLISGATLARGQQVALPPRPAGNTDSIRIDPSPAEMNEVLEFLNSRNPKRALERATPLLRLYPDSIVLNCAVGEAGVENNDSLAVHRALESLKRIAPQQECVAKLEAQHNRMAGPEIRQRALELVKAGDLDGARHYVASAHLDPSQEFIIQHYIDRAQTHFANAMYRLDQLAHQDPSEANEVKSLREETLKQAREFVSVRQGADSFLFDPVATSSCTYQSASNMFDERGLSLQDFFTSARDLVREYPSEPDVQGLYFIALTLVGTDESLQHYGQAVLEKYNTLSIPFFSRDALYILVLDHRQKRITLKVSNSHPENIGITDGLRPAIPFDLPYSEIGSLRQYVSSSLPSMSLSDKSIALDFGKEGSVPYYALMPIVHCLYGEPFERRATARLGRFVALEIGIPPNHVKLVNPAEVTHDRLGAAVTTLTVSSILASQVGASLVQQVPVEKQTFEQALGLQQIRADQLQDQGEEFLAQRANEASEIQQMNDAQRTEAASMEEQLVQQGFERAFDLDVPGYLEILASMLQQPH